MTAFRSRIPHQENGICQLLHLIQNEGSACIEHHNHLLGHIAHRAQQFHLISGNGEFRTAAAFSALDFIFSQRQDRHIRIFRGLYRLLQAFLPFCFAAQLLFSPFGQSRQIRIILWQQSVTAFFAADLLPHFLKRLPDRHNRLPVPMDRPHAQGFLPIRIRAYQSDFLSRFQRKRLLTILQKHHALSGRFPGQEQIFRLTCHFLFSLAGRASVRILEQSQLILQAQDAQNSSVQLLLRQAPFFYQFIQTIRIAARTHINVHACFHRHPGRFLLVFRHAVRDQFRNRRIVRDNHAAKSPFPAQDFIHQPLISGGRNSVYGVERRHNHLTASFHPFLVRRQVFLAQAAF